MGNNTERDTDHAVRQSSVQQPSNKMPRILEGEIQRGKTFKKPPPHKQASQQPRSNSEQLITGLKGKEMPKSKKISGQVTQVDPLCHRPVVTPPGPIKTLVGGTPMEPPTYTHVSFLL